ncbi:hypothetical protein EOA23_15075 [Mesorhizobium sp. M2A.F.Ca.ET.042.01.1.1]|nr:hypothetical protein EOA23_15075 [Mesorhizobium sp. M2A.F.Ca.ET.042.01.1.1]
MLDKGIQLLKGVLKNRLKFTIILLSILMIAGYFGRNNLSISGRYSCGPLNTVTAQDRAKQNTLVETDAMTGLLHSAAEKIIAQYPDPAEAWCESKRIRNVRIKVGTLTEVDRNVEHYLWVRAFVAYADHADVCSRWIFSKVVAVPAYSVVKLPDWILGGSPPTWAEFAGGLAGVDAGYDYAIGAGLVAPGQWCSWKS